jgi:hypothetical protein
LKEEIPKDQTQQTPPKSLTPSAANEKVDESKQPQGDAANEVKDDKVDPKGAEDEGKKEGTGPETKSLHTEDLNLDSSVSQPKPSISAKSNQASSTHELT